MLSTIAILVKVLCVIWPFVKRQDSLNAWPYCHYLSQTLIGNTYKVVNDVKKVLLNCFFCLLSLSIALPEMTILVVGVTFVKLWYIHPKNDVNSVNLMFLCFLLYNYCSTRNANISLTQVKLFKINASRCVNYAYKSLMAFCHPTVVHHYLDR